MTFEQGCKQPVEAGLYLGYLKLSSTLDQLSIMAPISQPNILPHVKIRDLPHVNE